MQRLFYDVSVILLRGIFSIAGKRHVHGPALRDTAGPLILASNHISHFDPPLISAAARRPIDWMAMVELFQSPGVARYLRAVNAFPTDRGRVDRDSVKTAIQRLHDGRVVGMFPEGGIRAGATSVLEGAPLRRGAASLAAMTGVPIAPCVVLGSDRLYQAANWWPWRRVNLWVGFGTPIVPPSGASGARVREQLADELGESIRALCTEMREVFQLSAADLPQTPQRRKGRE